MARAKRRSSTQNVSPSGASTTPTSNSTPMFSSKNSVVSETPMTTEIDEAASEHVKPPPERARARRASAVQALNSVSGRGRVQKRKAATSIKPVASNKKKRITRSSMKSELNNQETDSEGSEQESTRHIVQGKGKGKGKARAREPPPAAAESASDGSLSGEEPICEESDGSGSEFVVSDEDEEIMLDAAVRMSLQTSRLEAQNGASSSAVPNIELSLDVARRAAAAELMVAQNHGVSDSNGFHMMADSDLELAFSDESSDSVRRRGKGKGKGKAKSKSKSKIDVKAVRAAMGRGLSNASELKERKALKYEEMVMSSKLCRKLTHVRT
jgi:DNA repair protein RAD16